MDTKAKSYRFWKLGGSAAGLVVLLVILVAANVIVGGWRFRKDLTQERLYTLTDGTRQVLGKLDRNVTLMFFYTSSAPDVPGPIKQFAQQVDDLLREYELVGGGRVVLEKYDPKPDSEEEDLAQRYGLEGQAIPQTGTPLYLGVVATCGDTQAAIPIIDPRNEELLEYTLTRLIHRVTTPRKPMLGVMSSLPVLGAEVPMMMPGQRQRPEAAWASFRDLQQDYEVRLIPPTAERIDDEVSALMVVHPKDLSDKTLYALDQFVLRGGHLLAFVDPLCVADAASTDPMGGFSMPKRSSDLGRLFEAWGIKYDAGKIVADLQATTPLRGRNNTVEHSPLYLSLRKDNLNKDDVMTAPLNTLMMVMAGAFTGDAAAGLKVTPLIKTSEQSALTDAMMAQFDPNAFKRQFKSGLKNLDLAIRVQGKFKTAFPEGAPRDASGDTNAVESAAGTHLTEARVDGNVILVADVDLLANDFCVQEMTFFGYSAFQPINDNVNLVANMADQVAGSSDLMGIRCRGRTFRPFTRVLDLQAQAQERWLAQEQLIEQKVADTEQRMAELQRKKDDKQRFVLSPEQAKEIERFRAEVLKNKQELKQVRRNLREGIEALGMRVKLINIALVPLLVGLAGLAYWLIRRLRPRSA
jgi:ABC-type uncharacterized transport system involved in gliding motility auxiliary subunit